MILINYYVGFSEECGGHWTIWEQQQLSTSASIYHNLLFSPWTWLTTMLVLVKSVVDTGQFV